MKEITVDRERLVHNVWYVIGRNEVIAEYSGNTELKRALEEIMSALKEEK